MGYFYLDQTKEDEVQLEKERKELIKTSIQEALDVGNLSDNNSFPEFLDEINMNDFGNEYMILSRNDNPNIARIRTLKRKYTNYFDFIDALTLFYEYQEYVETYYGDYAFLEAAYHNGSPIVYIPPYPKLANKKENKRIFRSDFLPSRVDDEFEVDYDLVDIAIGSLPVKELDEDEELYVSKEDQKLRDRMFNVQSKNQRMSSIYSKNATFDALIQYLNNPTQDQNGYMYQSTSSVLEDIKEYEKISGMTEEELEEYYSPDTKYIIDKMIVSAEYENKKKVFEELAMNGFDVLGSSKFISGLDKSTIKALKKKYDREPDLSDMTPKELAKYRKKKKKKAKMREEQYLGDKHVQEILSRNKIDLSLSDNAWDFRLSDVFGNN